MKKKENDLTDRKEQEEIAKRLFEQLERACQEAKSLLNQLRKNNPALAELEETKEGTEND